MATKPSPYKELGVTGRAQFGRLQYVESDPALQGANAIRMYDEMRRTDPTGMAMYQVLSLPVRRVSWRCDPGGEKTDTDKEAAKFVWSCLNDMSQTLNDFVSDICLMFAYGWTQFWMVLKRRTASASQYDDGRVGFRKMEMVNHRTLVDWEIDPQTGDIVGPIVLSNNGQQVTVPLTGSLLFRTSREGDDPEGISIYRAAVRPYTYKRRLEQVEGIGLHRRWAGFPKVTLPLDATTRTDTADGEISDEERAESLVQAIYEDRMMGAVIPNGWGLDFGGPAGNVDTTMGDTIMRKDTEMARAILAQFMLQGMRRVGTQSLAGTLFDAFTLSVEAYLEEIRDELNRYAIPALLRWNDFPGLTGMPTMEHTSPRNVNLTDVAAYLRVLAGGDLLTPDVTLESFLRSLVPGMPTEVDEAAWEEERRRKQEVVNKMREVATERQGNEPVQGEEDAEDEDAEDDGETVERNARFFRLSNGRRRKYAYGEKPAISDRPATYRALADKNAKAQRAMLEGWTTGIAGELAELPGDTPESDLRAQLDDYVLTALLLFRERSMLDIAAAFWLGFGAPSGPPEALQALQGEITLADSWIGYGPGGTLARTNPAGKPSLFGDIAGQLEGQIAAILLLLKQGRRDEVAALVTDTVRAATQGYSRAEHYAGHVWRGIWVGAAEKRRETGDDGPVRWVMDPIAHHCHECPIYGADPPGREYPSMAALLAFTGGTSPGYGTECDGDCRCHLEELSENGVWGWM